MGGLSVGWSVAAVVLAAVHVLAGAGLGMRFRFGILLPAFAVVIAEALVGDFRLGLGRWYLLAIAGIALVEVGYALAARLSPFRQHRPQAADSPSLRIPASE
jgi:hypothetical protein